MTEMDGVVDGNGRCSGRKWTMWMTEIDGVVDDVVDGVDDGNGRCG